MGWPPDVFISGGKYYWNDNTKSTGKCSYNIKCICKQKHVHCPINTYMKVVSIQHVQHVQKIDNKF